MIEGLILAENLTGRVNKRRQICTNFPAGRTPLMDLVSRMKSEESNSTEFAYYEDRYPHRSAASKNISTTVMFADTTSPYAAKSANFTLDESTNKALCIQVASTEYVTLGDNLQFNIVDSSAAVVAVQMTVTSLPDTTGRVVGVVSSVGNSAGSISVDYDYDYDTDSASAGRTITFVGNARGEGTSVTSGEGFWEEPVKVTNYLQLFKRTYDVSREVLKSAQDYDGEGIMDELYWKQGMFHMEDMERAFFNGLAKATTDANGRRLYLTGGLKHYLQEWEKADSIYRGGSGAAAITGDTNFDKRIIANSAGTITADLLDDWGERMFNRTNSIVDSKIAYCGSTALNAVNKLLRDATNYDQRPDEDVVKKWGSRYHGYNAPQGDIFFTSHKLFNSTAADRQKMYFVDLGYLKWRYFTDGDTKFIDNIQTKREDIRQDMWITHGGFELQFPEAHMLIEKVTGAA